MPPSVCPRCGSPVAGSGCVNPACRGRAAVPVAARAKPTVAARVPVAARIEEREPVASPASPPKPRRGWSPRAKALVAAFSVGVLGLHVALGYVVLRILGGKSAPDPTPVAAVAEPAPSISSLPTVAASAAPVEPPRPAPAPPTDAAMTTEQVYSHLLKSSVLILAPRTRGAGSGAVVDAARRLVVTNEHVVQGESEVILLFPAYDDGREVINSTRYYVQNAARLGVRGRVLRSSPGKDLALLELDRLPPGVEPLPLSPTPARTGSAVFSVGGSGIADNLLWRLTTGTVRGRAKRDRTTGTGDLDAVVLETDAAVNPGDSGGPVVNNRGKLVAVVAHFLRNQREVSGNIDVTEVRDFLTSYYRSRGWAWNDAPDPVVTVAAPEPTEAADAVALQTARLQAGTPADRLDAAKKLAALGPDARPAVGLLLKVAVGGSPELMDAVADAVEKIGPGGKVDPTVLTAAVGVSNGRVRAFALRELAALTPTDDTAPALLAATADPSPAVRLIAVKAVALYQPRAGGRGGMVAKLLKLLDDPDPAVADAAAASLDRDAWRAAVGSDDLPDLRAAVKSRKLLTRAIAAGLLGPAVPDAKAAADLHPLLADVDPRVRAAAAAGLARWPTAAAAAVADIVSLGTDGSPEVRTAAIKAMVAAGPKPAVVSALLARAKDDADPGVKRAAARALARLPLTGPAAADAVGFLLGSADPDAVTTALESLPDLGDGAKPLAGRVAELVRSGPPEVRPAAVKALAPLAAAIPDDAAVAFYELAVSSRPRGDTDPRPAAVAALGKLGSVGVNALTRYLDRTEADLKPAAISALGDAGKDARGPAAVALVRIGQKDTSLREPVTDSLARIGGDAAAAELRTLLRWGPTGLDPETRRWAIATLDAMGPDSLSADEREQVYKRLFASWGYEPVKSLRERADLAMRKFKPGKK